MCRANRGTPIADVQPIPQLFGPLETMESGKETCRGRQHMEVHSESQVIQREDAQNPPRIEIAEGVRRLLGVDQDSGDQEAGENKKEIDAAPSEPKPRVTCGSTDEGSPVPTWKAITASIATALTPSSSGIFRRRPTSYHRRSIFETGYWWARRDSNPGPPRCKRGALTN